MRERLAPGHPGALRIHRLNRRIHQGRDAGSTGIPIDLCSCAGAPYLKTGGRSRALKPAQSRSCVAPSQRLRGWSQYDPPREWPKRV